MRNDEIIGQLVERASWRMEELRRLVTGGRTQDPVMGQLLHELQTAVEELQVSEEELRQQNEALLESRVLLEAECRRFQDLFDSAPYAYLVTDRDGVVKDVNAAGLRLFGVDTEVLVHKPLTVFVPDEQRRAFRRRLLALREPGTVLEWEMLIAPRGRDHAMVAVRATSVEEHGERQLRWIIRDESERRETRAATQRLVREQVARTQAEKAERALRGVLDNMPAGFFTLDSDRHFTFLNSAAAQILGKPWDDLNGHEIWKVFPEAIGSQFYNAIELSLTEGMGSEFREHYVPRDTSFDVHVYSIGSGTAVYLRPVQAE